MNNYINKSDLLIEIEAEKKENLYEEVLKMQKEYQYDLLVLIQKILKILHYKSY